MSVNIGDVYEFKYPDEPQFDCKLKVIELTGALAFFDDGSHCKIDALKGMDKVTDEGNV